MSTKRQNDLKIESSQTQRVRRKRNKIDYVSLNEGEGIKNKNVPPHLDSFNHCFEEYIENGKDQVISCENFIKNFNDISVPYLISDPENSGMEVPGDSTEVLSVDSITKLLGGDCKINVMDVLTQENEKWELAKWNDYFTNTKDDKRDRLKNVISFEVSHFAKTKNFKIKRPTAVSQNDLVDIVWDKYCNVDGDNSLYGPRPKVTKYILMSVKNAFTDFHLDFAGTPVYYKLLKGSKKFILFPPTQENLDQYLKWCNLPDQSSTFLGNSLQGGISMELKPGDLFMIPAGYIHVVYTPEDSLIIGGNFLTFRDILTHLKIVDIEHKSKVPKTFTFPKFDVVIYKTAEYLLDKIKNGDECINDSNILQILKSLKTFIESSKARYSSSTFPSKKSLLSALSIPLTGSSENNSK